MRKIKYRAKRIDNGEWIFGHLCYDSEEDRYYITNMDVAHNVDRDTIGEFVGQNDVNGDEIYEGDLLQTSNKKLVFYSSGSKYFSTDQYLWEVFWKKDKCGFFLRQRTIDGQPMEDPEYFQLEYTVIIYNNFKRAGTVYTKK